MAAQPSIATLGAEFDNSFIDTSNQAQQPPKTGNKDKSPAVLYRQIGVPPGEAVELTLESTIPQKALRQTLDRTHEMLKAWKSECVPR